MANARLKLIYKLRRDAAPLAPVAFVPARLLEEPVGGGDRTCGGSPEASIVVEFTGGARVTIGAQAATVTATLWALAR